MKLKIIILLFSSLTASCGMTSYSKKGLTTPEKENKVDFFIYGHNSEINDKAREIFKKNNNEETLDELCPSNDQKEMGIIAPLLTTLGKFIFDSAQTRRLKRNLALKKASTISYSGRALLSAKDFKRSNCLILVRYKDAKIKNEKNEGNEIQRQNNMVFVAKIHNSINDNPSAFTFEPAFIRAKNSVSTTKKSEGKINIAIALSVNAIGLHHPSGLKKLGNLGAGAVSIGDVRLDDKGRKVCEKPNACNTSEVIPHLPNDTDILSVTMSMTEVGQTGIDFDQREAEIKAIKEAFGPAIEETLKAVLAKD